MIVRTLTCAEHKDYGFMGWRPNWIPHFDPSSGLGVAHDVLEHARRDPGTIESEFQAFGAIVWLRGESGWFYEHRPHASDIAWQMASDFMQQAEYLDGEGRKLHPAPKTRPLAYDGAEDMVQRCVTKGLALIRSEHEDGYLHGLIDRESAVSYMRMGYRAAERRLGDSFGAASLFDRISEGADRHLKNAEPGMELTLRVDTRAFRVQMDVDYPND